MCLTKVRYKYLISLEDQQELLILSQQYHLTEIWRSWKQDVVWTPVKVLIYNINYNQCKFEIMTHAIATFVIHFYCYFHLFAANNGVRVCIQRDYGDLCQYFGKIPRRVFRCSSFTLHPLPLMWPGYVRTPSSLFKLSALQNMTCSFISLTAPVSRLTNSSMSSLTGSTRPIYNELRDTLLTRENHFLDFYVSILHKAHIKNFQRITLIKEIQYLESIVRLLKKFNFTKQISAFQFFLSKSRYISLFRRNKYCHKTFKESKTKILLFQRFLVLARVSPEGAASLQRSPLALAYVLSPVPSPQCHIIHCLLTRLRRETRNVLPLVFFSFPPPSRVNTH